MKYGYFLLADDPPEPWILGGVCTSLAGEADDATEAAMEFRNLSTRV